MTRIFSLIFKELRYHRFQTALCIAALAAAVAICVAMKIIYDASQRETRRVTRDLGFNLRIIPRETEMGNFLRNGFSEHTMPADSVDRLVEQGRVAYNHLLPTLRRTISIEGHEAILTGVADEVFPPGHEMKVMQSRIAPGAAHVGFEVARWLKCKKGDTIELAGSTFTVARCAPEMGTTEDIEILLSLSDAQRVLGLPDQINEIQAIDCLCLSREENPLEILRGEISKLLPESKVVMKSKMADARARQRQMIERVVAFAVPALLIACAAWVGALSLINVRQRESEIGLLRALGYRTGPITVLLLGKAVFLGLVGALIGYFAGTILATGYGPRLFPVTAGALQSQSILLAWALLATPLFAAVVSFPTTALAISQDPATTLRKD